MPDAKLILTDLDGTLLRNDHCTISPRTRAALLAAKAQGVKLSICTGRCLHLMPESVLEPGLLDYAITSNGACCVELVTGKTLFSMYLSPERAALGWSILQAEDPMVEWFVNGGLLLDRHNFDRWQEKVRTPWHVAYIQAGRATVVEDIHEYFQMGAPLLEKINVMSMTDAQMERLAPLLAATGEFTWPGSLGNNMEITGLETTKATGMRQLCDMLGIPMETTVAFGDGGNDAVLLAQAGVGVAMANSRPETLAAADAVTLSNEEDGVGVYIERHVLQ